MPILIEKVLRVNELERSLTCLARHYGNRLQVTLVVDDLTKRYEGKEFIFEMSYQTISNFNLIPNYSDAQSGLFPSAGTLDAIDIVGRVHNIIGEEAEKGYDIYMMNGAEFIYVRGDDINHLLQPSLAVDDGVRFTASGLKIYPGSDTAHNAENNDVG